MTGDLFTAIESHDPDALLRALRNGADPDALQEQWPYWRPLHAAIEAMEYGATTDAVVLLLRNGAQPDGWDGNHDATPLLMACFREQWAIATLLLARGAKADVVGAEGDTPLSVAVAAGQPDVVRLLLRCGVGPTLNRSVGVEGLTPLGLAARQLDLDMVRILLAGGADLEAIDADRRTARERMPDRDADNAGRWDAVAEVLGR